MLNASISHEDIDNQQVTAIISHLVRLGREQDYEEWIRGFSAVAQQFRGYGGLNILRTSEQVHPEYVLVLRFDCSSNFKDWLESDTRSEWIERLQPLIARPEDIQAMTGLETWFVLPQKLHKPSIPRYKMVLVTWLGVFIVLAILTRILAPLLSMLPLLLNQLVTTGLVALLLTYVVMPQLMKLFRRWLSS
ncbi:antibiotic biosynthesis monooxygenase [Acaryochloris marina]|uniref:ABM domain-containing protein n=1 Tax=Acaryochloris marina (strain MBIC 11017) TaxID=329726 RepID=A8ZK62_ACAM1|nr:antibiotic biosynthesis monooxygenase [Acaryochloris marina]ABW31562.1 conserved hypothetical protein [Acaryochloris marina MBIC11017]